MLFGYFCHSFYYCLFYILVFLIKIHKNVTGDDEFKGMAVHKVGGMYDSVDIFKGAGKINVRIAGDSPLAIFKDIARAIPC